MRKKIFILPSVTDLNRGDQALVWESVNLVKEILPDADFFLFESGNSKEDTYMQTRQTAALGYNIVPRILKHPGRITKNKKNKSVRYSAYDYMLWGLQAVADLFVTSLLIIPAGFVNALGKVFLSKEQKQTLENFKKCGAVFVKGGGFIHAYGKITDIYLMYFSLYYILLALRYKKSVYILPNSIGPLKGYLPRTLVKYVLKRCELVTVRENVSKEFVEKTLGIHPEVFPDLGFYLKVSEKDFQYYYKENGIPLGEKKLIGITLRPYRFPGSVDPEQKYNDYISEIVTFVKELTLMNCHVVFFAHTLGPSSHEDDRIALKDVIGNLPEEINGNYTYIEDFDLTCSDVTKIYSYLDFMVGTRFHSVIFALNVNVPSVAIAYGGNKSFGIMNDLNLNGYVFPIESVKATDLLTSYLKAMDEKESYIQKIQLHAVHLKKEKDNLVSLISQTLK